MSIHTDPERLASEWRRRADTAIENGETPLLALGLDSFFQTSCLNLLALNRVARRNLGPQNPTVIAGGDGWLWLLATLVWRHDAGSYDTVPAAAPGTAIERRTGGQADGVDDAARMVLYAGADSALYAATLNIAAQHSETGSLPPGLDWSTSLTATRGTDGSDFELLAPVLVAENFIFGTAAPGADGWLHKIERWAGGLLALGLLIAAFLG